MNKEENIRKSMAANSYLVITLWMIGLLLFEFLQRALKYNNYKKIMQYEK